MATKPKARRKTATAPLPYVSRAEDAALNEPASFEIRGVNVANLTQDEIDELVKEVRKVAAAAYEAEFHTKRGQAHFEDLLIRAAIEFCYKRFSVEPAPVDEPVAVAEWPGETADHPE